MVFLFIHSMRILWLQLQYDTGPLMFLLHAQRLEVSSRCCAARTRHLIKIQDESIDLSVAGEIHYSLLFKC
jgi:hypothetical protein